MAAETQNAATATLGDAPRPRPWLAFFTARRAWLAGFAAGGVALFLCYLWVSRTQPVPSDGASNALEAWDMLHGNLLLHGWTLTDVSFYPTELPEYMGVELVRGLSPDVVHVAAALTYTLLVVLAALLAKGRSAGREAVVRVALAAGLMLAPELGNGVHVLLQSPDHAGTGVPLLATFLLLDRAPRRWWVPPLAGLMLAIAVAGDKLAITIAVLPLVLVCAVRVYRSWARDEGVRWFELSVAGAALAAAGLAALVLRAVAGAGGFTTIPLVTQFAGVQQLPRNFWLAVEGVLGLYGADFTGMRLGPQAILALLHLMGVAVAAWAVARAARGFLRTDDLIVQVLVLAIGLNLAAYLFSTLPSTIWDSRQIAAVLPFGAVLAGRLLAGGIVPARLVPLLTCGLTFYLIALGYAVAQPAVPASNQGLADWLEANHLSGGLSDFDQGNSTTLDSGGRIQLRTVSCGPHACSPRIYQSKTGWYDPGRNYADFVVNGPGWTIPPGDLTGAFGQPAQTYHYGPYTIMVWTRNLLALLGPPSRDAGDLIPAGP